MSSCWMTREPLCPCAEACASWLITGFVFSCLLFTYGTIFTMIYFSTYKPREKKPSEEWGFGFNNHYTVEIEEIEATINGKVKCVE